MNRIISTLAVVVLIAMTASMGSGDDALERRASWQPRDAAEMAQLLRSSLDQLGVPPTDMDQVSENFLEAIEKQDADPLDALIESTRRWVPVIDELANQAEQDVVAAAASVDPDKPNYGALESLPRPLRMSVRTWLGRELVRRQLYDEALPVLAEVDASESLDQAAVLFYRGVCYHALLMKEEALADLRRLLENEEDCPVRFSRTAQLMVADIKPLKEDSLDEISRMMSDVTRRLGLGRTDEEVKKREQEIIDKLSKLIDKLEQQQQQQQQQQQSSSGGSPSGGGSQGAPMQDSRIAGGNGAGDVDRKSIEQRDGWGNLPPAERQQTLQQISRDLPTHYREAIEAYFRKLATDK